MKVLQILTILALLKVIVSKVDQSFKYDKLEQEILELKFKTMKNLEREAKDAENSQKFGGQYECVGGMNPSQMSKKQYIEKFAEGPCSPTVFLPGILSTLIQVVIDCEKLRDNNYEVFRECGWTTCQHSIFDYAPKSEYQIWLPGLLSPMSLVENKKTETCFSGIARLSLGSKNGKTTLTGTVGVSLVPIGQTPKTKSGSECGFKAIQDLLPISNIKPAKSAALFRIIKENYLKAGYLPGLTMQALPYDWRVSYRDNALSYKFKPVLESLYQVTGKRTIIVAHSMGNFQVTNFLWNMDQTWKDKYVSSYIAMAPPFLGSARPYKTLLGLDPDFFFSFATLKLGIPAKEFKKTIPYYPVVWQLMMTNFFDIHKDEDWMKAALQRIKVEKNGGNMPSGTIMDLFPNPNATCNPGFSTRTDKCITGLRELKSIGSINSEPITIYNAKQILQKYSYLGNDAQKMHDYCFDNRVQRMDNLGVQTNIIYSNILNTTLETIQYNGNPKPKVENNEYIRPDKTTYGLGDSIVMTTSALMSGIKWAAEFSKSTPGVKPINMIEVCSSYNQRSSIYDDTINTKVTKNAYFGVDCECRGTQSSPSSGKNCQHGRLLEDQKIIDFLLQSSQENKRGIVGSKFRGMTESQLGAYVDNCSMFNF